MVQVRFAGDSTTFRLLEWPGQTIPDSLVIRGRSSDAACVCTDTETFAIRQLNVSNTILVVQPSVYPTSPKQPPLKECWLIRDQLSVIWEASPTLPKLERVRELLAKLKFRGNLAVTESPDAWTINRLLNEVQASRAQLIQELRRLDTLCLDGSYWLVDDAYMLEVLEVVMATILAEGIPLDSIPVQQVVDYMRDDVIEVAGYLLDPSVVRHCCLAFSVSRTATAELVSFDYEKAARLVARNLMRNMSGCELDTFMEQWQVAFDRIMSGDSREVTADWLRGIALIQGETSTSVEFTSLLTKKPTVTMLLKESLPYEAEDRFKALFKIQSKWKQHDLLPYVNDLAEDEKKLNAILLKNTRSTIIDNVKWYNSRFPVAR